MGKSKIAIAAVCIILAAWSVQLIFAEEEQSGFDHSLYAQTLRISVVEGLVNYTGLKMNSLNLDRYLTLVGAMNPRALDIMTRNEKTAFYINVYNARTLQVILEHYPVSSIKEIPGVWNKIKFKIAGKQITLDEIEHGILRAESKDPRIHFALVCAAKGCPGLRNTPFTEKNFPAQLNDAGRKFLNDKTKNRLDKENNILYLSSIFKWFKEDFGNVKNFIEKYMSKNDIEFIEKNRPKIRYQYDWSLNELK
ncbi:MAG: DUF547 domain-containing protein [Candidatus Omnitrophota bacterium]